MEQDLKTMSPTENWLWALTEARQENDAHRARLIARNALGVWRCFMAQRPSVKRD
jgi:hypothetical protein